MYQVKPVVIPFVYNYTNTFFRYILLIFIYYFLINISFEMLDKKALEFFFIDTCVYTHNCKTWYLRCRDSRTTFFHGKIALLLQFIYWEWMYLRLANRINIWKDTKYFQRKLYNSINNIMSLMYYLNAFGIFLLSEYSYYFFPFPHNVTATRLFNMLFH